jgi:hypothetical protein
MIAPSPTPTSPFMAPAARPVGRPLVAALAKVCGATPRFTVDGSAELEAHLVRTCAKIAAGLRGLLPARQLEAVLLGGGYGRGEGGVLRTPEGDKPYNDLEFYVCLRGNRHLNERLHGRALHVLGEILTPQAGVEVEFKITSLRELTAQNISMFSYDLVNGHRWLIGDESLLAGCAHHGESDQIPLAEATRLLMNRATGLLLAQERLERSTFTASDADFTRRNIAKAELALGDAVLVCHGQYHSSVRERHHRLERIARAESSAWLRSLLEHHAVGVAFKLLPERSAAPRGVLVVQHREVCRLALQTWLWLESRRLHRHFHSAADYVACPANKWPEAAGPRNLLVNLKVLGPRGSCGRHALRHPRERVLNALALLLWEPHALGRPETRARIQSELRTEATTLPEVVAAYREIWQRVN